MADVVLRHGVRIAPNASKQRLGIDAKQAGDLCADVSFQGRVVVVKQLRLQTAANEGAQQQMTFGRSAGIFQTAESAGHDFARFVRRHDEAKLSGIRVKSWLR